MGMRQTRRCVSLRGDTYRALLADCQARGVSVSSHLEQLIAADFDLRGVVASAPTPEPASPPRPVRPPVAPPVHPPAPPAGPRACRGVSANGKPCEAPYAPHGWCRFHQGQAVQRRTLVTPEGRDGEPMREVRTRVALAKAELRW